MWYEVETYISQSLISHIYITVTHFSPVLYFI